jgi:hypothetical protein
MSTDDSGDDAPTDARVPSHKVIEVKIREEFGESLEHTFKTDLRYRRIVATAAQAYDFYTAYQPKAEDAERIVELDYGKLRVLVRADAITKMYAWVLERSQGLTLEVQGRFLGKRRPDHLLVDDFIPIPSFCQSLAYETRDPEDRRSRFGAAKMRSIGLDDWKPLETGVYERLGIFSPERQIPIDPFKVAIPFHSHYLRSDYQQGPSPGDYDHIFHIKWVYTPRTGRNILYSGIAPFQADVPFALPSHTTEGSDEVPLNNPDDCELIVLGPKGPTRHAIPPEGVVIGRQEECAIILDDPDVSRTHARIFWSETGELVVEDLKSKNGTLLDGGKIERAAVTKPSELLIGNTRMRIVF